VRDRLQRRLEVGRAVVAQRAQAIADVGDRAPDPRGDQQRDRDAQRDRDDKRRDHQRARAGEGRAGVGRLGVGEALVVGDPVGDAGLDGAERPRRRRARGVQRDVVAPGGGDGPLVGAVGRVDRVRRVGGQARVDLLPDLGHVARAALQLRLAVALHVGVGLGDQHHAGQHLVGHVLGLGLDRVHAMQAEDADQDREGEDDGEPTQQLGPHREAEMRRHA